MTATISNAIEDAAAEEFVDPRPPGLGPFGKVGTIMLFVIIIATGVLMKLVYIWLGVGFFVIAMPLLAASTIRDPVTHQTRLMRWNRKRLWKANERAGRNKLVCGPVSDLGTLALPGYLAQSQLHEAMAGNMQRFGLVEIPSTHDFGIGIKADPDGASLLADETLLRFTDRWGKALRFLCNEPGVIQAAVTIQTAPDPGDSERDRILSSIHPSASAYSRRVLTDLANMTPPGAAVVESFVTVTVEGGTAGIMRPAQEVASDLAPRLPKLLTTLTDGGAGHCELMSAQDITDAVQAAYDPGARKHIAKMKAATLQTGARWESIGPPRADNQWTHYRHASAVSVTWTMVDIEGAVNLTTLEPLIRADIHCDVKRVTIIYRTRKPQEKNRIAQKDKRHAQFHAAKTDSTHGQLKTLTSADKNASDVARSAGLVDVAVVVTASVTDQANTTIGEDGQPHTVITPAMERVAAMVTAVEQAAPQAMLAMIRQDGGHAATFTAGLGMGVPLVPRKHSKTPTAFQEDL